MDTDPSEIIAIYRQRWAIEMLFKQIKQNFPLKYFYGESANAIKIQGSRLVKFVFSQIFEQS